MHRPLHKLAETRTGLTLRGQDASRKTVAEGLHLLRISDIRETGDLPADRRELLNRIPCAIGKYEIRIEQPHLVEATPKRVEKYKVRPGDVVIANRGSRLSSAVVAENLQALVGGQLFIIRVTDRSVRPAYLSWFINLEQTQKHLMSFARGSYVKTISIKVLREELVVPVPPVETQRRLVQLAELAGKEQALLRQIGELKHWYLETSLSNLAKECALCTT